MAQRGAGVKQKALIVLVEQGINWRQLMDGMTVINCPTTSNNTWEGEIAELL